MPINTRSFTLRQAESKPGGVDRTTTMRCGTDWIAQSTR